MIRALGRFFAGEVRLLIQAPAHLAANLFIFSGVPVYDARPCEDGYAVSVEHRDKQAVMALCQKHGFACTVTGEKGIFPFLKKLLFRPGPAIGLILSMVLLWQCSDYVWDIRVYGNERLSEEEVVEILKENGFYIGCRHSSMDLHELCNIIPIGSKDVAWISINMMGSVAEIQVVELRPKPENPPKNEGPVNLVAEREGLIVRFELSSGRAVASVGQTVSPGQLLVAGFSEKETGLHPKVSAGRVYAKTMIRKERFIAFQSVEKEENSPILLKKSINILGKEIFFYKKGRLSVEEYDIVCEEYRPTVLGIALPLRIKAYRAVTYMENETTLTAAEARDEARRDILEELSLEGTEILETEFFYEERAEGIYAVCQAECIVDIAKQVPIIIEGSSSIS